MDRDLTKKLKDAEELEQLDEYALWSSILLPARNNALDAGEELSLELRSEFIAFGLRLADHVQKVDQAYEPRIEIPDRDGAMLRDPDPTSVDEEVVAYWRSRFRSTSHPVMVARYADLVWEFGTRFGRKRDPEMARAAVSAIVLTAQTRRHKSLLRTFDLLHRAMALGRSLNDSDCTTAVASRVIELEEQVGEDHLLGLWGHSFDMLVAPRKRPCPELVEEVVEALEQRLSRLAARAPNQIAKKAKHAATRLGAYYARKKLPNEVRRVLVIYGSAVDGIASSVDGLGSAVMMERLAQLYQRYGLHEDAVGILKRLPEFHRAQAESLRPVTGTVEIPTEAIERFSLVIVHGGVWESIGRIVSYFTPTLEALEAELDAMREVAPLFTLLSTRTLDEVGRTTSVVGGADTEDRLFNVLPLHLVAQGISLRAALERLFEQPDATDDTVEFISASAVLPSGRLPLVKVAIDAFARGDRITFMHVAIPLIESMARTVLAIQGERTYQTNIRDGGVRFRTLDDLLSTAEFAAALGPDSQWYLRALLTDKRGWNLRNDLCHGLLSADSFVADRADRVLHVLLLLASLQEQHQETESEQHPSSVAPEANADGDP